MNLAELKKRRAVIKGSCTRISNAFPEQIPEVNDDMIAQACERKSKLEFYWAEYDSVQSKIETLEETESPDRVRFEEDFYALSVRLRRIMERKSTPALMASPSTSDRTTNGRFDAFETVANVRLPKLNLPTFTGKYDEWFPFFDVFKSVIDSNASLSNIQRFQYLKGSLSGEAAEIIQSLELSDRNYEVAWGMLKERYDNRRVIVHTHLRAIFELTPVVKENARELRQLSDGVSKHVRALHSLQRPTDSWDDLLIYIVNSKLDTVTSREWQNSLVGTELPTLKSLLEFISHRCHTLEATCITTSTTASQSTTRTGNKRTTSANVATVKSKCMFCNGNHPIHTCKDFIKLTPGQRLNEIRKQKTCVNCLRSKSHNASQCNAGSCKTCGSKHNTLLHLSQQSTELNSQPVAKADSENPSSAVVVAHTSTTQGDAYVMLSTALVRARDKNGIDRECRVLLDCGSQANFITRNLLETLQLKSRPCSVTISGFGDGTTAGTQIAEVTLNSRITAFTASIECIVVDKITDDLPTISVKRSAISFPRNIKLADPFFNSSASVDMLIGAGLFWQLLCVGQINAAPQHPALQKTKFGWIVAGPLRDYSDSRVVKNLCVTIDGLSLRSRLSKFWELESIDTSCHSLSPQEKECERHFLANVSRDGLGRLCVKLPMRQDRIRSLGESRETAMRRFKNLEKRLLRDEHLRERYSQFMREYRALSHMKLIDERTDAPDLVKYYMPHHSVEKESSQTTKLRVVFDASCKSSTGLSLNDVLLVGPVVQQDLVSIILRFRMHTYVLAADITKMYRQVLLHESQTSLQRIFWRDDISEPIDTYELVTVTYGTASASFLATRCLKYLAHESTHEYPIGSQVLSRDFYVDDMLTGADSIDELRVIRDETTAILARGHFVLSKWASNNFQILEDIPSLNADRSRVLIDKNDDHRILGIQWNSISDEYYFYVEISDNNNRITKRSMLSEISQLFDPLGLLSPIIITAKILIQKLWELKSDWDASVPCDIHTRWIQFKGQLSHLNNLRIPRRVKFSANPRDTQLHGFCDASEMAYGACIYMRSKIADNEYRIELLCSKSRVSPLRAVSLPRLELCAAVLLAELHEKVRSAIDTSGYREFLWSDSTITLNWILSSSRRWSTFVANRVGEIQRLTCVSDWRHVRTGDNPADIVSRGVTPEHLIDSDLWWHGPKWLGSDENAWPESTISSAERELPEEKRTVRVALVANCAPLDRLMNKFSSLSKLSRVIGYLFRFTENARRKFREPRNGVLPDVINPFDLPADDDANVIHARLSPNQISRAIIALCKYVQTKEFPKELHALQQSRCIDASSKLLSLSPFLDAEGTMRVGGRLKNSREEYSVCHPILLPKNSRLTELIIEFEHARNMHAGTQATMAAIRRRFWPLSLRTQVRKLLRRCIICFKAKPLLSEAIMGQLPIARVTPSRPFSHSGVDYGGPFMVRDGKRRNSRYVKAYIAIFICLAVKAIHIELVGDLTTESFLGALKRFISRRGKIHTIYSDNGTNFVGAARELKELYELFQQEQSSRSISEFFLESQVNWKFIPPNAPHFGGLWEAGVKSAKYHMQRIIGNASLTYEEMQTVLCEIESILNSRPITPLSNDPNDLSCLSPGHFLVGEALNSFPQANLQDIAENRLSRWQRVEQLRQHFWQRWQREYLSQLHERHKWKRNKGDQLQAGCLVLVHQPGLAPLQWLLGRVQQIHVGRDGIARSATVKTTKGIIDRPLSKLSIMPLET